MKTKLTHPTRLLCMTLLAWGDNGHGQTTVPLTKQSGVTAKAASGLHNGALVTPSAPAIITQPMSHVVLTGATVNLSVSANGTPPLSYQWRFNEDDLPGETSASLLLTGVVTNQAGNYTVVVSNFLGSVTSAPPAVLRVAPSGAVVEWSGNNWSGPLTVSLPEVAQNGVTAIAAGGYHRVALKDDGSVVAWGDNFQGQTTVPVAAQSGVIAIAAGDAHTVALKNDGSVVTWGHCCGQTNVPVAAQSGVIAIAAGQAHTVALKNDGSVLAWGANGTTVPVEAQSGVTAIAAGALHTVALKSDGTVVAWGFNSLGQTTVPPDLTGVTAIAAGGIHSAALKSDGTVVAWGGYYEDGDYASIGSPSFTRVKAIASGRNHLVALFSDGTVDYWGAERPVPRGLMGVTAIAAGVYHTVALVNATPLSNPTPIRIRDDAPASPYPSTIEISGFTGPATNVMVTLFGLSHTWAADISILLVGPAGQKVVLMSGAGGGFDLNEVTLTFDDGALEELPAGQILTGNYKPTNRDNRSAFWQPAPSGPYGSALSVFNGTDPNGAWQLFVMDVEEEDVGIIAGGWSLTINTSGPGVSSPCGPFDTWAGRVSSTTNALNDVAFGNGRFVAVGGNFNIANSSNGVDWTSQFVMNAPPFNGVTFGNGLFVAVGAFGYTSTSTNGTIWSGPFSFTGTHLHSVSWGNGTFVAVGTNGVILNSLNGTAWPLRVSGRTNSLTGVTYGNGRFVVVGNSGAVLVSTNGGTNWISGTSGTLANLADVTSGNGQFVAVGTSGTLLTSTDGLVWTARASGTSADLTGVTYGGGRFVAVGNATGADDGLTTSVNGISWVASPLPRTALWNDVVFGHGNFVAVGQGGAILQSGQGPYILGQPQSRIVCATDPVSFTMGVVSGCPLTFQWQFNGTNLPGATSSNLLITAARVEDAGAYRAFASDGNRTLMSAPATLQVNLCRALDHWTRRAPPPGSNALNGVACAPDSLVAVGNAGTMLRSADGLSWLASPSGTNVTLSAVAHGGGTFVAVGFNGVILTSSNAADWTLRNSGTIRHLRDVAHGGGQYIAVGDLGTVLSSPDGVAWTAQNSGTNRALVGLTRANDQFIAVGQGGYIATSPDGANWSPHSSGVILTLYDVACGNGIFVAVGNAGAITTSTNGVDWIRQTSPASNRLHGVTWASGTFAAVGDGGLVLSSPDGIAWTIRNSGTTQDLYDITYCGNAFVTVGANGTLLRSGFIVAPRLYARGTGDGFELDLTSEIGVNYRVQASPILPATQWLDLSSVTSSWPVITLRDPTATNAPQRFYRVVSP